MNIKINLEDKMINPGVINLKQFTSGTDQLVFLMPDYIYETTDLSAMDCYAVCDMPVSEEDYRINETMLSIEVVEDVLQITWPVSGYTTDKPGTITYQIVFKNKENDQSKIWSSDKAIIFINSSVKADGLLAAMYPDIFMQWQDRMKQTHIDSVSNVEETKAQVKIAEGEVEKAKEQVGLAADEVEKAKGQVGLAADEVEKAKEQATNAAAYADASEKEAGHAAQEAIKAKKEADYVKELVEYEGVPEPAQEVAEARGAFPLLVRRLEDTDVKLNGKAAQDALNALALKVDGLNTFNVTIVEDLPVEGEALTIYFVAKTVGIKDIYDEYMWLTGAWEHIGSTDVDLSGYYSKTETDGKYAQFKTIPGTIIRPTDITMLDVCARLCEKVYDKCKDEAYFSMTLTADLYNDNGTEFDYMGVAPGRYIVDIYTDSSRFNFIFKSITNSYNEDTHMYTAILIYDSATKKATFSYGVENKFLRFASAKELDSYYTKTQIDSKINFLKMYNVNESEASLLKTLDKIYKDIITGAGNYDSIQKELSFNFNPINSKYNYYNLIAGNYFVTMYQHIRSENVLFTFKSLNTDTVFEYYFITSVASDGSLSELQHGVKSVADGFIQSDVIKNKRVLTQAQYAALPLKDANTEYTIVG